MLFCASCQGCWREEFANVPELPEMQALSERLGAVVTGACLERIDQLGFTGLKTVHPSPKEILGACVVGVSRRAKYLIIELDADIRVLVHLSQAGRMDFEEPAK